MKYVKVEVFIPEADHLKLMEALNAEKLLGQGKYDFVFATTQVMGHWRPLEGADPAIGEVGKISREPELKIEFRIQQEKRRQVEQLIRKHHPYEEPAINFIPLDISDGEQ